MSDDSITKFKRIGIVGAGNMGTMMAYGFSEQGLDVSLWDISEDNVNQAMEGAKQTKSLKGKVEGFKDIKKFVKSLDECERRLFIFSITHGSPADQVIDKIKDDLKEGDIILDGGNENYRNTERRQKEMADKKVIWIGTGVSGGYQSARHGPSMSPGGDKEAIELVLPLLQKFSAKDEKSTPCVDYIGPRGAGHFVKMCHNGIEGGMLSTVCEVWALLHNTLGLENDEIGKIFEKWIADGELRNTYLLQIGSEICQRKKTPKGDQKGEGKGDGGYVLDDILDKVVQDDDNTEGTPYWTVMELANRHIAGPTIADGHFFRVASGNRDQRLRVAEKLKVPAPQKAKVDNQEEFIETLRQAVYTSFLLSFCQGLELIARASKDEDWNVNLGTCIKIWRAGCIIQEDYIADMLQPILEKADQPIMNIKLIDEVAADLHKGYQPLKKIVSKMIEWDAYAPSLAASLEYMKYEGGTMLASKFMEAEMDFFGVHSYDKVRVKGEDPGKVSKGGHHYEWRPA